MSGSVKCVKLGKVVSYIENVGKLNIFEFKLVFEVVVIYLYIM